MGAGLPKLKELEDHYNDLSSVIENYYGAIEELKAGLIRAVPETPEILQYLEMCEANNIPLKAGGLLDQPHIFLIEANIARNRRDLFQRINNSGEQNGT